jgi:hypothetical protein
METHEVAARVRHPRIVQLPFNRGNHLNGNAVTVDILYDEQNSSATLNFPLTGEII